MLKCFIFFYSFTEVNQFVQESQADLQPGFLSQRPVAFIHAVLSEVRSYILMLQEKGKQGRILSRSNCGVILSSDFGEKNEYGFKCVQMEVMAGCSNANSGSTQGKQWQLRHL